MVMVRSPIRYGMRYSATTQFVSTTALHLCRGFCTSVLFIVDIIKLCCCYFVPCLHVYPYKKNKVATTMCVHNKVVSRLSQPCGDSLTTWCSSYKVATTLWGQPCNLVFLLQGCHNLVVTTYSRPDKLGWEVRLL